ncbi:MAG: hypothetical protein WC455_24165 [Dehalococcoidia bacterium]|jgi:hypothetical protein
MGGAYVAKPAAEVPVDYPPGWDISWPFPGAAPPGYSHLFSMTAVAADTVNYNGSLALSTRVVDAEEYVTLEPSGSDKIYITATIDDEEIGLRVAGGEEYSDEIELDYSGHESGDLTFYGADTNLEFDLSEDNEDDTVVISIRGGFNGLECYGTKEVDITVSTGIYVEFSLETSDLSSYYLYDSLGLAHYVPVSSVTWNGGSWNGGSPVKNTLIAEDTFQESSDSPAGIYCTYTLPIAYRIRNSILIMCGAEHRYAEGGSPVTGAMLFSVSVYRNNADGELLGTRTGVYSVPSTEGFFGPSGIAKSLEISVSTDGDITIGDIVDVPVE